MLGKLTIPAPSDAQHVVEHAGHVLDRLQRLGKDDDVELPVGEGGKPLLSRVTTSGPATLARMACSPIDADDLRWPRCRAGQQSRCAIRVPDAAVRRDQVEDCVVIQPMVVKNGRVARSSDGTGRLFFVEGDCQECANQLP